MGCFTFYSTKEKEIIKKKLIEELYKLPQDELVLLWNEYQYDVAQNTHIYSMDNFNEIVSYENIDLFELMWAVRDRKMNPEDSYFFLKNEIAYSFDDVFMSDSPININDLAEHLIKSSESTTNEEIYDMIMNIY